MSRQVRGLKNWLRLLLRFVTGKKLRDRTNRDQDELDVMGEIERFRRGGDALQDLVSELAEAEITSPDWRPRRVGPTLIVSYTRFAERLSQIKEIKFLPNSGPDDFEIWELHPLPVETFLEYLRTQAGESESIEFDVALTRLERTLTDGEVLKMLLVRVAERPLQSDEAMMEAFGAPPGWWLAVDPEPILQELNPP